NGGRDRGADRGQRSSKPDEASGERRSEWVGARGRSGSEQLGARRATRGSAVTTAEVTIDRIAAGGDGIGRVNELVVFVPRSAPGDRARVRLDAKKRFARG